MSYYFDEFDQRVNALTPGGDEADALVALETELVRDVSVCTEVPGFPADLKMRVHQVIFQWSTNTREVELPDVDVEDWHDMVRRLGSMSRDLHTVFHDVARRGVFGFTDNPRQPLSVMENKASEYRVDLYKSLQSCPKGLCPSCGVQATFGRELYQRMVDGNEYEEYVNTFRCDTEKCDLHGPILSTSRLAEMDVLLAFQVVRAPDISGAGVRFIRKSMGMTEEALMGAVGPDMVIPQGTALADQTLREKLADLLVEYHAASLHKRPSA